MAKILIARFSALGDIAMTIPIIADFAKQYPEHSITMLSRSFVAPLFKDIAPNIRFKGINLSDINYKGIKGVIHLYKELKHDNYDYFIDFHDVLRTKLLRFLFCINGTKVSSIDKERNKRKKYIKTKKESFRLKTSFERYTLALNKAGFYFENKFNNIFGNKNPDINSIKDHEKYTCYLENKNPVGIAPFTTHRGKEYPQENMEAVIKKLSSFPNISILLFGAGKREQEILEKWQNKYTNVISLAGKLDMRSELILMSKLKVMVSMDSANMHLASLVQTPVISIWGATTPECGFLGWKQSEENAIQLDLSCRPCSIFGNRKCKFNDYRCIDQIRPECIINKIKHFIL